MITLAINKISATKHIVLYSKVAQLYYLGIEERMRKMEESGKDTHRRTSNTDRNLTNGFDIQTKIRDGLMEKISRLQSARELD